MAETADGKVWLGTLGDGLFLLSGGRATNVNAGLADRKINCELPIGEELWVGTDTGLYHGNGNGLRRVELPSFLGNVQVLSILRDRDSNMWLGTTRGLLRINGKGVSFSEENELRGDGGINVLFEDREGNLWIGGARGLARIRDSAFVTYSSVSDRRFGHNGPVYVDPDGRTWFAPAQGGLMFSRTAAFNPLHRYHQMRSSIPSVDGTMCVGRTSTRGTDPSTISRRCDGQPELYRGKRTSPKQCYVVYESRDGSLWAGTLNGGVRHLHDDQRPCFEYRLVHP
jgi:ligand-binding sensor domain-containing protein